jgi:hypothetical protein
VIAAAVRLPVQYERQKTPAAHRLLDAIPPPLATAVGISIPAHVAGSGAGRELAGHDGQPAVGAPLTEA